jgi:hypothetical protein
MTNDSASSTAPQSEIRRPQTPAERQRAYRERQRQKRQNTLATGAITEKTSGQPTSPTVTLPVTSVTVTPPTLRVTHVTRADTLHPADVTHVTASRRYVTDGRTIGSYGVMAAALSLAAVGITMNGWFARTLGATDAAGWLFLAIGVASDFAALAVPPAAARLWQARHRTTAAVAWLVWSLTFVFAVTSGIGFASVNIADVTITRASRVTPAVTTAQDALRDAMTSRTRECSGGVGPYCRQREQAVADRQHALDTALGSVEHTADPQSDAAAKIVTWLSAGTAKPGADSFAMLRLLLLALLPQIGGILLMIGRMR